MSWHYPPTGEEMRDMWRRVRHMFDAAAADDTVAGWARWEERDADGVPTGRWAEGSWLLRELRMDGVGDAR